MKKLSLNFIALVFFIFMVFTTACYAVVNCGNDINCFIGNAKKCQPAVVIVSWAVTQEGVTFHYNDYYEIGGPLNGKCYVNQRVIDMNSEFTEEARERFIKEHPNSVRSDGKLLMDNLYNGMEMACAWDTDKLVEFFMNRKEGKIIQDQDLYKNMDCQGALAQMIREESSRKDPPDDNYTKNVEKDILRNISTAAETYATGHQGTYPTSIQDLLNADPPFIKRAYCGETLHGYTYECRFTGNGYEITASPSFLSEGASKTYVITTGGVLTGK